MKKVVTRYRLNKSRLDVRLARPFRTRSWFVLPTSKLPLQVV
jgi:hypothetical protein